jgi:hypothetical protein
MHLGIDYRQERKAFSSPTFASNLVFRTIRLVFQPTRVTKYRQTKYLYHPSLTNFDCQLNKEEQYAKSYCRSSN